MDGCFVWWLVRLQASIVTVKENNVAADPDSLIFEAIKSRFTSARVSSLKYEPLSRVSTVT